MRPSSAVHAAPVLAVSVLALAGCAGQQFVADTRLSITSPRTRATVDAPVTVRWTMRSPLPGGSYAVFVDRAPIKVGQTVRSVIDASDHACKADPACPDAAYLSAHNVYVTRATNVTIDHLPVLHSDRSNPEHEVTVILLDAHGKRTSESAWFRDFKVRGA